MDRYREKTSAFFTKLADDIGRKRRPATIPPPKPLGSPPPQTSLIFELSDELILSILSHVSPGPHLTGHHARFRVQYCMVIDDYHQQRVQFLLSLSMTCRAMRLRLLPWVWERLECLEPAPTRGSGRISSKKCETIVNSLHADASLASSVRFITASRMWNDTTFPEFVKCLESLPNLHTLEIARADADVTTPLENALQRVQLPQIQTLILPSTAHPLLRHCPNVEDVVYVVGEEVISSDEFLVSLASNLGSKVKRLAIPLVSWGDPSRFAVACPQLTELTLIFRHPHDDPVTERGIPFDAVKSARSATLELVNACKVLPDFDTLQIVYLLLDTPSPRYADVWNMSLSSMEQQQQAMREQATGVRDLAMDCLKEPKTGCREGAGRKRTTLRVIELNPSLPVLSFRLDSLKVEEHEV